MKTKKLLAYLIVFAMMLSLAATFTFSVSAQSSSTSWFEFDKKTGGWKVKDISRAADGANAGLGDHGHRVQIIPFGTEEEDMPSPSGYEVLLSLPEMFDDNGEEIEGFVGIAQVRAILDVDWVAWNPDERMDFCIVLQDLREWYEQKEGGKIAEILAPFEGSNTDIEPDPSTFPKKIEMVAEPKMSEKYPFFTAYAEYFKVMVTNYAISNKNPVTDQPDPYPAPPITATVNLIGYDGKVIPLVCPDCNNSPCTETCPECKKAYPACTCEPCVKCGEMPCVCPPETPPPGTMPPSKKTNEVIKGFPEWNGSGDATVTIKADSKDFDRLVMGNDLVTATSYEVKAGDEEGTTLLTIKEAYLKTLQKKSYNFSAYYKNDSVAEFSILINPGNTAVTTAPAGSATTAGSTTTRRNDTNPKTGVASGLSVVFIPALVAAGAVMATTKTRKKRK